MSCAPPPSVLYESKDKRIAIIDVPRSIEESQAHVTNTGPAPPPRRLLSAQPVAKPFETPEPRDGGGGAAISRSSAAQIADLMTAAAVDDALQHVSDDCYEGPWYLPRVTAPPASHCLDTGGGSGGESGSGSHHFIPDGAKYLEGSIEDQSRTFRDTAPAFNLILMDPPWPNRSVRRKKGSYSIVADLSEMRRLLSHIPVPAHLDPSGLVAVWTTNKPAIVDFLTSPGGLFASWGLELTAEWTWVKVTASGEPIYPVDSSWRKPWEKLLIAKRRGAPTPLGLTSKTIISVPDLHSRKPNLRGVFQEILGSRSLGLEVFARHLTVGWWSWGDEVLLFQDAQHWTEEAVAGAEQVELR